VTILGLLLLEDAHPELARRFLAGCVRFGSNVQVNSVLRDTALQTEFRDCYETFLATGKCPPTCTRSNCAAANQPGTSNHEPHGSIAKSLAIDAEPVDGDWPGFWVAMEAEGLVFNIRDAVGRLTEPWHCQCKETPATSYEPGSEDRLPLPAQPPGDPLNLNGCTALVFIGE
jgi:hypothetical protein